MVRNEPSTKTAEQEQLEELLVDVPPAQRDLLRREIANRQPRTSSLAAETRERNSARGSISDAGDSQWDSEIDDGESSAVAYQLSDSDENYVDNPAADDTYVGQRDQALAQRTVVKPNAIEEPYMPRSSTRRSAEESTREFAQTARHGDVVSASYEEKRTGPAVDESLAVEGERDWRQHVHQAIEQLEWEASTSSPEEQVNLEMVRRLLHLSTGDLNAAMEPIDALQPNGQDFVRHSLESLYEVTNPRGNPIENKRYTLAMLSQRKAMNHLAAASNLEVRNVAFCTEVDGFGVVTKFPKYNFQADQQVLLYCELDNFVSDFKEGKGFETQLQGSYEIVDMNGHRVADQLLPLDSHVCRNQRRDYFIAYRIYLPQDIAPGRYQMKLVVEDMKGRKFGQASVDFQIGQ